MCICCSDKCAGIMLIIAGVLLALISFEIWFQWLNLTLFFAIMAIILGIHAITCKDCKIDSKKK